MESIYDYQDKTLKVTFTFDQLVYIIDALEEIAEYDNVIAAIMPIFDSVEVYDNDELDH